MSGCAGVGLALAALGGLGRGSRGGGWWGGGAQRKVGPLRAGGPGGGAAAPFTFDCQACRDQRFARRFEVVFCGGRLVAFGLGGGQKLLQQRAVAYGGVVCWQQVEQQRRQLLLFIGHSPRPI